MKGADDGEGGEVSSYNDVKGGGAPSLPPCPNVGPQPPTSPEATRRISRQQLLTYSNEAARSHGQSLPQGRQENTHYRRTKKSLSSSASCIDGFFGLAHAEEVDRMQMKSRRQTQPSTVCFQSAKSYDGLRRSSISSECATKVEEDEQIFYDD